MALFYHKHYVSHHIRVRQSFGELSIPSPLKDDQLLHDKPNPLQEPTISRRAPISAILNQIFVTSYFPIALELKFDIPTRAYPSPFPNWTLWTLNPTLCS